MRRVRGAVGKWAGGKGKPGPRFRMEGRDEVQKWKKKKEEPFHIKSLSQVDHFHPWPFG